MNLANQITVSRLAMAAVVFVLLDRVCRGAEGAVWYATFAIYILAVASDGLDGYIARTRGQITAFGRIADPLADKIVICGVLVLCLSIPATSALVPTWIVLLVLAREFLVSGLRAYLEGQGTVFGARWEGKTKLVVQAIYCGALLFYPGGRYEWVRLVTEVALWATALITAYSGLAYVGRARKVLGSA